MNIEPESPIPSYPPHYAGQDPTHAMEEQVQSPRTELLSPTSNRSGSGGSESPLYANRADRRRHRHGRGRPTDHYKRERERAHAARTQNELMTLLIEAEFEAKSLRKSLATANQSYRDENTRCLDAERIAKDLGVRLRQALDGKLQAEQDTVHAQEELRLHKMQLDHFKLEVERAQRAVDSLTRQRNDAERSAARARGIARKLDQKRQVEAALEEGRRLGFEAGFRRAQDELRVLGRAVRAEDYGMAAPPATPAARPVRRHSADMDDDESILYDDDDEDFDRPPSPATRPTREQRPFVPPGTTVFGTDPNYRQPLQPQSPLSAPGMPEAVSVPVPQPAPAPRQPPPTRPEPSEQVRSRSRGRSVGHAAIPPTPAMDMYHIDIPSASAIERQGNINPARPPSTVPPDNFIPTAGPDGGIGLPPPNEWTPHPTQAPALPPEAPAPAAERPPAAPTTQGGQKPASWYNAQNSEAPPRDQQQYYYPAQPKSGTRRRGSLLGTIGRGLGAAFRLRKSSQPPLESSKPRINLDSPSTEDGPQLNAPTPVGTSNPAVQSRVVPSIGPAVQSGTPGRLPHRRSRSENLHGRSPSALRENSFGLPPGQRAADDINFAGYGSPSRGAAQPSMVSLQHAADTLRYSNPDMVDQWRKEGSRSSANPKSPSRHPRRPGHLSTPNPLSPASSAGRHLYVANRTDDDPPPQRPPMQPAHTSGTIGISIEPPSDSQPTLGTPSPYGSVNNMNRGQTPFIPPGAISTTSLFSQGQGGRKTPRMQTAGFTPSQVGQQPLPPTRPGSALSTRSRSRSVGAASISGPIPMADTHSIRRSPSNASIRSGYSARSAASSNYAKFDKSNYLDPAYANPEPDTPTRQNTLFNAGMTPRAMRSGTTLPGGGVTPAPGRPRSLRSVPGRAASVGTSIYADP